MLSSAPYSTARKKGPRCSSSHSTTIGGWLGNSLILAISCNAASSKSSATLLRISISKTCDHAERLAQSLQTAIRCSLASQNLRPSRVPPLRPSLYLELRNETWIAWRLGH